MFRIKRQSRKALNIIPSCVDKYFFLSRHILYNVRHYFLDECNFLKLFLSLGKRLLLPLSGFLLYIFLTQYAIKEIDPWLVQMHWTPYLAMGIAALISLQFGRSRLFFCCLASIVFYAAVQSQAAYLERAASCFIICVGWLLWRPDKGFSPLNGAITALEITLFSLVSWLLIPEIEIALSPVLGDIFSLLYALGPAISAHYSPSQILLVAAVSVISFVRLLILPTNNQVALFVMMTGFCLIIANSSPSFVQLVLVGLSVIFIVATLIDSFNMAFRDELTGIPSRRAMMQYIQTLGRKYIVVMSDIDHFKKFNDTHGHDVGDQVLKLVASKLQRVTGGGKAFRFGGEEFVIIFPRKTLEEVTPHVEVLRQMIASYPIVLRSDDRPQKPPKEDAKKQSSKTKNKTVMVTCSFGLAEKTAELAQFEQVMKEADVALYAAKKAGRNCVKTGKK